MHSKLSRLMLAAAAAAAFSSPALAADIVHGGSAKALIDDPEVRRAYLGT